MLKSRKVYLDYAAGVRANPSSIHVLGLKAKNELQNARREIANVFGARPDEIIFTSGGTESNNLAISGIIWSIFEKYIFSSNKKLLYFTRYSKQSILKIARQFFLPHIITTNIEHPSVLETCKMLKRRGLIELSIVSVESNGIIDPKKIKKEIKENTVLISVMYANNEIGTVQPIKEIAKEVRYYRKIKPKNIFGEFLFPLFHTDAIQAINYLDLNVEKLGVDLLSLSSSKIEGVGRIGMLYKKKSVLIAPMFGGGDQEMGLRPGTENLIEILKFSKALKLIEKGKIKEIKRFKNLQNYFLKKLKNFKFDFIINGDLENRLPNNINITFPNIPSELLVLELSAKGIMVSSKSTCKSLHKDGSYVIEAIHFAKALFLSNNENNTFTKINPKIGGVRFSFGKKTSKADIDYTIKILSEILQKLKKWYN